MKKMLMIMMFVLVLGITPAFADSTAGALSESSAVNVSISPQQMLQPQPIYPYMLQLIPGVVGDATRDMAIFDAVKVLTTEKVIKVVTFNGWCFDRIRLEDVEKEVIANLSKAMEKLGTKTADTVRFRVKYKMSSRTIGSGGGGGGSMAGFGGGANPMAYGANASIMPGIAVNTADPQFIISFYLVRN